MKIAVIGGGAAGMMCAALLTESGIEPVVFEKNEKCGRKLAITGKGRCNVTNFCDKNVFFSNVPTNPKFLYSSYSGFSPADTMSFFEGHGVPLKIERGNRVFPVSDRAYDIVDALYGVIRKHVKNKKVCSVEQTEGGYIVKSDKDEFFDCVVVATGGLSYPLTGSTGDGFRFAEKLGIKVTGLYPSLVPLRSSEPHDCASAMGLSLKNIRVSLFSSSGKRVFTDFGEMLFTHFGVSGPLILSASAHICESDLPCYLSIDLKPALEPDILDSKLVSVFSENPNKDVCNSLGSVLPSKIIRLYLKKCSINPDRKCNSVRREERERMVSVLKDLRIPIRGKCDFSEAVITRGGIDVSELDPRSMEVRKHSGLYFIGEVIDVDAYTGGFNLQIAFSTAAACAADIIKKSKAAK